MYWCGVFDTEIQAAISYNKKFIELFGDENTSKLNIIPENIMKTYNDIDIAKIKDSNITLPKNKRYFGVSKKDDNYISRFSYNKTQYWVGTFSNQIDAINAYNKKALEICGNDAKINIIS